MHFIYELIYMNKKFFRNCSGTDDRWSLLVLILFLQINFVSFFIRFYLGFFIFSQVRKSSILFYSSGTMEQSSRDYHWTFSSGYYYKWCVFEIDTCDNSCAIFILHFIFKIFVRFISHSIYMLFVFRKLRLFARFITPADSSGVQ